MEQVHSSFPRLPSSVALARAWADAQLHELLALSVFDAGSVLLVVSELVTNAVLHGQGTIWLGLDIEPGCVEIRVRDAGPVFEPPAVTEGLSTSGWGFQVVEAISVGWGVEPSESGKTVWAAVPVSAWDP